MNLDFLLHPAFIILALIFLSQAYIYTILYSKILRKQKSPDRSSRSPGVSIVICAKNEEANLRAYLPAILNQEYPEFEVIVVNDQSEDHSQDILRELEAQYPLLKVMTIEPHINEFRGKKFALTLAFKAAKYDILLLTDADCEPTGLLWVQEMISCFCRKETEFVLGYSPYGYQAGILNLLIRFETLLTGMNYLGLALAGSPYMGVGRNLAYRKSTFFNHKGFAPFLKLDSGDDDLFVNQHATASNTSVCLNPEAFTISNPAQSWSAWLRQKKRHQFAGRYYKTGDKVRLGLIWLSGFGFYIVLVISLCIPEIQMVAVSVFVLRFIMTYIIYMLAAKRLKAGNAGYLSPILDLWYYVFYLPLGALSGLSRKSKKAKW